MSKGHNELIRMSGLYEWMMKKKTNRHGLGLLANTHDTWYCALFVWDKEGKYARRGDDKRQVLANTMSFIYN
jgi:hypothetical protein